MIPGSEKLVFNKVDITKMNKTIVATGMSGLTLIVRYGQLQRSKKLKTSKI